MYGSDDLIVRFNANHALRWATCFGGLGKEGLRFDYGYGYPLNGLDSLHSPEEQHIAIDDKDNVYIGSTTAVMNSLTSTTTDDMPCQYVGGRYNQQHNASYSYPYGTTGTRPNGDGSHHDGYFAQFAPNNSLKWSTHFGGEQFSKNPFNKDTNNLEFIGAIAVGQKPPARLYFTGFTRNNNTPTQPLNISNTTYNQPLYGAGSDVFIGLFISVGTTSVNEVTTSRSANLLVFPNPSSGRYNVSLTKNQNKGSNAGQLLIYNAQGQVVIRSEVSLTPGKNKYNVDITHLPAGIYFLQLVSESLSETVPLNKI